MKRIILASASPRRKELLEQIGLHFDVEPSYCQEKIDDQQEPLELAKLLSLRKAKAVSDKNAGAIIIAADTFVVLGERIIGKPNSLAEAKEILTELNGTSHSVITGFTIMDTIDDKIVSQSVETKVYIKGLSLEEINTYVETQESMGKAGAYAIQGLGAAIIDRIEGDYFNVMGLPVDAVVDALKQFGISSVTLKHPDTDFLRKNKAGGQHANG
jgi:septum formation protein